MWSILILVEAVLTIPVIIDNDEDISKTVALFKSIEQSVSGVCYNGGDKPLNAVQLQRKTYQIIKGQISSQMTLTALRCVAGAYALQDYRFSLITLKYLLFILQSAICSISPLKFKHSQCLQLFYFVLAIIK